MQTTVKVPFAWSWQGSEPAEAQYRAEAIGDLQECIMEALLSGLTNQAKAEGSKAVLYSSAIFCEGPEPDDVSMGCSCGKRHTLDPTTGLPRILFLSAYSSETLTVRVLVDPEDYYNYTVEVTPK